MKKMILLIMLLVLSLSACRQVTPTPLASEPPALETEVIVQQPSPIPSATKAATATQPPKTSTPTNTQAAESAALTVGPDNFPSNINPLTGQPVQDLNLLNRRPIAVKIQLYPRGQRPVWGVSLADHVYDYYQNDGLTRLNAVFYGQDAKQVGPVRSARFFDEQIIRMYKSFFAFGGATDTILKRMLNADYADWLIREKKSTCPPLCRSDPNGYNFLFLDTPEVYYYALRFEIDNQPQNLDGFLYSSQPAGNGQTAEQIFTRYSISSYNRWDYDPASGLYLRFQDTQEDDSGQGEAFEPLMDGLTNQQIAADNVVVILLTHQMMDLTGEKDQVDISLSGSGDAYAFRDGQAYKVRWNRLAPDALLSLTFEDGTPYPIKPGNTWFQVVGQSSKVETPEKGVWRFNFRMP